MEKNGLTRNTFVNELSVAEKLHKQIENSRPRKMQGTALQNAIKQFSEALKNNNVDDLLFFEKAAQQYDIEVTRHSNKRLEELTSITAIQDIWIRGKDPSYARTLFDKTYGDIEQKPTKLLDSGMDRAIKSRIRSLGVLASGTANVAENAFYVKRQECLRFINNEHQKNINFHIGIDISKQRGRGLKSFKG